MDRRTRAEPRRRIEEGLDVAEHLSASSPRSPLPPSPLPSPGLLRKLIFPSGPVFGTNPPDCIAIRRLFTGTYPSGRGFFHESPSAPYWCVGGRGCAGLDCHRECTARQQRRGRRPFERRCRGFLPIIGHFAARRCESTASLARHRRHNHAAQPTPPAMPPSTPPAAESVPRRMVANPFAAQNRGNMAAIDARNRTACKFHSRCFGRWSGRAASQHRGNVPLPAGGHARLGRAAGGGSDAAPRRSQPVEQRPRGQACPIKPPAAMPRDMSPRLIARSRPRSMLIRSPSRPVRRLPGRPTAAQRTPRPTAAARESCPRKAREPASRAASNSKAPRARN